MTASFSLSLSVSLSLSLSLPLKCFLLSLPCTCFSSYRRFDVRVLALRSFPKNQVVQSLTQDFIKKRNQEDSHDDEDQQPSKKARSEPETVLKATAGEKLPDTTAAPESGATQGEGSSADAPKTEAQG